MEKKGEMGDKSLGFCKMEVFDNSIFSSMVRMKASLRPLRKIKVEDKYCSFLLKTFATKMINKQGSRWRRVWNQWNAGLLLKIFS